MLEKYTQRIVSLMTGGGGLQNHEDWCKLFELVREVYTRGKKDGFYQCKNKVNKIDFEG